MLIFLTVTLIIYVFSNIKTTTIEEVNKKLVDTTLVVDDMVTQAPDPICMCDSNGMIIKANDAYLTLFELQKEKSIQKINIFSYPFGFSEDIQPFLKRLEKGESILIESIEMKNGGNTRYLSLKLYPTYSSDDKITSYIFNAEDITERKHAEYMLKNAYEILEEKVKERTQELSILNSALNNEIAEHKIDEEKIKASLKEKEVLLKEIHHRVKNNMQIISSMLGLQTSTVDDPRFNEMMKDSQNRIRSMALIHENLYRSENMAEVNFSEYVSSLVNNIYVSYRHNGKVQISIDIDNISLDIDTAIPLGLIMNELITNSFKHAFPKNMDGEIKIKLSKLDENRYNLIVQDNGVGLPKTLEITNSRSLGLQLVNILIEQIEGSLKVDLDNGVRYTIEFPNRE
jgi:PAS domain S-box-containing protein